MIPQGKTDTAVLNRSALRGKTILITRPREQAEEFSSFLQDRGATVVFVPAIQILPPGSWEQFDAAIESAEQYDGFIFTSANAVRGFFQRLDDLGKNSIGTLLVKKPCYAVGGRTGDALKAEGIAPTLFPEVNSAEGLAASIRESSVHGKRFMFPKGSLAGPELPAALRASGAEIDEIVVYETIAPREGNATIVRDLLKDGTVDVVTFFSPSSVRNLLTVVPPELISSRTIAVIGATTATAARECGLEPQIIAPRPTAMDLANAIIQYFTTRKEHQ